MKRLALPRQAAAAATALAAHLATVMPLRHLRDRSLLDDMAARWCERHRVWHGPQHLLGMLEQLATRPPGDERDVLMLAALYHDAVYDPRAANNEESSAALLFEHAADPLHKSVVRAAEIVIASKWVQRPESALIEQFFALDSHQLAAGCPLHVRLAYEHAIFCEYQWADWKLYRTKRREFLEGWARLFPEHRHGVEQCMELLAGLQPRVAVYPGSFDPFHLGHLSILRQAEAVFDKVIVAVGINRQKSTAIDSAKARHLDLQSRLRFHEVASFGGLLTRFIEELELPVTIVRGVRDGTDLEAELRFVRFLNELRPDTRVVWMSCEAHFQHLSSSAIRELEAIAPGSGERYVPGTATIYELAEPAGFSSAS